MKSTSLESFHTFTAYHLILSFANKILFSTVFLFLACQGCGLKKERLAPLYLGQLFLMCPKQPCVAVHAGALLDTELLV